MTSRFVSLISSFKIVDVKYLLNSFLSMFLNVPFAVWSRGCRIWVELFGTFTVRMFNSIEQHQCFDGLTEGAFPFFNCRQLVMVKADHSSFRSQSMLCNVYLSLLR